MATIDERIVQMEFDNKQFEQGLGTSLKSLDTLDAALKNADKGTALTGLTAAVQTVSDRFSTLGIIGMTALQNITNQAIIAGQRILNALTIRPAAEGFAEYELKLNTIQAIMNATGAAASDVEEKIRSLDDYADKTVYSTRDMFDNLATFTNSGVALDKATVGIANATALAGQSTGAATIAYRNFSDGIANGFMNLMDFRSLSRVAKIATQEFRQELMDAGVSAGTLTKGLDGVYRTVGKGTVVTRNFEDTLKDQWLTSEALLIALNKYGDETTDVGKRAWAAAQDIKTFSHMIDALQASVVTSWSRTMEIIFGDLGQSKMLWTSVSNAINEAINQINDSRNAMLEGWANAGGRVDVIETILNALDILKAVLDPIRQAFENIFPPLTWESLKRFTEGIRDFTRNVTISGGTIQSLRDIFEGVFSAVDIGIELFKTFASMFGSVIRALAPIGIIFLDAAAAVGRFITAIRNLLTESGALSNFAAGFAGVMSSVADVFKGFLNTIRESRVFHEIGRLLSDLGIQVYNSLVDVFNEAGEAFGEFIAKAESFKLTVFENLRVALEKVRESLSGITQLTNPLENFFNGVKAVFDRIFPYLQKIAQFFKDVFGGIAKEIQNAFKTADFDRITDMLETGLFASIVILIDRFLLKLGDLFNNASKVTKGFADIIEGIAGPLKALEQSIKADAIMKIATAIGVLVASLVVLSMINEEKLASAVAAITFMFAELQLAMRVFGKTFDPMGIKTITSGMTAMIAMTTAVLIMSFALAKLASIPMDQMMTGLIGLVGIFTAMSVFITKTQFSVGMAQSAIAMQNLAVAMLILSAAVGIMGSMELSTIAVGLIGIGGGLLVLTSALSSLDGMQGSVIKSSIAIGILSTAMLTLTAAVAIMGNLKLETIGKALIGFAGGLLIFVGALELLDRLERSVIESAGAVLILSSALVIFGAAMAILGNLELETIGKGLLAAVGGITAMAVALSILSKAKGSVIQGSIAIGIMAAALNLLIVPITVLGALPWQVIATGLGTIVIGLTAFGIAAKLLTPIAPTIVAIGTALALMGVAAVGFGIGVAAAVPALLTLVAAFAAGGAAIIAAMTGITVAIAALIPTIAAKIGEGVIALARVITEGAPVIGQAVFSVITTILETIAALVPEFMEIVSQLFVSVLSILNEHGPKIIDVIVGFVSMLIETLDKNLPKILNRLMTFIVNAVNTLAIEIDRQAPRLIEAVSNILASILNLFIEVLAAIVEQIPGVGPDMAREIRGWKKIIDAELAPHLFVETGEGVGEGVATGIRNSEIEVAAAGMSLGEVATKSVAAGIAKTKSIVVGAGMGLGIALSSALRGDTAIQEGIAAGEAYAEGYLQGFGGDRTGGFGGGRTNSEVKYQEEVQTEAYKSASAYNAETEAAKAVTYELEERVRVEKELAKARQQNTRLDQVLAKTNIPAVVREQLEAAKNIPGIDLADFVVGDNFAEAMRIAGMSEEEGASIMSELAGGMESAVPDVAMAAGGAGSAAKEAIQGIPQEFQETGKQTVLSYISGIKEMGELLKASVQKAFATDEQTAANIVATLDQAIQDIEERVMTIYESASDRFGRISTESEVSVREMIDNLRHNQMAIAEWADGIAELAQRGLSEGLLEELRMAGPASAGEVKALVTATDTELQTLETLFNQSGSVAVNALVTSVSGETPQMITEGRNIVNAMASGLTSSTAVNQAMTTVIEGAKAVGLTKAPEFTGIGVSSNAAFNTGLAGEEQLFLTTQAGTDVAEAGEDGITSNEEIFANQGRTDGLGFQRELRNTSPQAEIAGRVVGGAAEDGVKENADEFYDAGRQAAESYIEGLRSKIEDARQAGRDLSGGSLDGVYDGIEMGSPSKMMIEAGAMAGASFAMGLIDAIPIITTTGEKASQAAVTGFETALNTISMLVFDEFDFQPTIRPVIDMTDIESGIRQMNHLFGPRTINTEGYTINALKTAAQLRAIETVSVQTTTQESDEPWQFTQILQSPKALDRLTIYRQTNNLFSQARRVVEGDKVRYRN